MLEPTSERVEGPTPAGGAYAVAHFSYDGRPVPKRFANQITIIEYDARDQVLNTTFGFTSPDEAMPSTEPLPEFDEARPDLGGAATAAAMLGARLGPWRLTPRRRSIDASPASLDTQAVCLARSWVGGTPGMGTIGAALDAASAVVENRHLWDTWIALEVGELRLFIQMSSTGAVRQSRDLPNGVEASEVFHFNAADHLAYGEQRIREVMSRLEKSDNEPSSRDDALRLARHALGAGEFAKGVWDDLLRAARAFVDHFGQHDLSMIPVPMTLEVLSGLREDALKARRALGLDGLVTAAACLVGSLGMALADVSDAHVRWYYHSYAKSLARIPEPETQNLHRVAVLMVQLVAAEGLDMVVTELARKSTTDAEDLIQQALAVDDLDDFYWLLYEAVAPLGVAHLVYHALASTDPPAAGADRMVNLIEEKRVRVETSLHADSSHLYWPTLATWYRSVQQALDTKGPDAARSEIFELSGHTLFLPTSLAETLKVRDLDGEALWEQLMRSRSPLKSSYAPARRIGEATDG
jgi:hypothetical protein